MPSIRVSHRIMGIAAVLVLAALGSAGAAPRRPAPHSKGYVTLHWLGHACFQFVPAHGPRLVIDPFAPMIGSYPWTPPSADAVMVTHEHPDHNAVDRVADHPQVVRGPGTTHVRGVVITGIPAFHDNVGGKQRGPDTLFVWALEGIRFAHLGDLGQDDLTPSQLHALGHVDVLFIPVGGFFTIDAARATHIVDQIHPRVVVPMHYKTVRTADRLPIVGVDAFLSGKRAVKQIAGSQMVLSASTLPHATTIMVLSPP